MPARVTGSTSSLSGQTSTYELTDIEERDREAGIRLVEAQARKVDAEARFLDAQTRRVDHEIRNPPGASFAQIAKPHAS